MNDCHNHHMAYSLLPMCTDECHAFVSKHVGCTGACLVNATGDDNGNGNVGDVQQQRCDSMHKRWRHKWLVGAVTLRCTLCRETKPASSLVSLASDVAQQCAELDREGIHGVMCCKSELSLLLVGGPADSHTRHPSTPSACHDACHAHAEAMAQKNTAPRKRKRAEAEPKLAPSTRQCGRAA